MSKLYDIAIAGGGLGGAGLAKGMSERGAKVLVVEHERQFKDRIRGEILTPWGFAEAHALGVAGCLSDAVGNEIRWMDIYAVNERMVHREVAATTPQQLPCLAFYHPAMQESLLGATEEAGASIGQRVPRGTVPSGEARNIHVNGGRYVSLLGSGPAFHTQQDRWPAAVDVGVIARFAQAVSALAVTLVRS